MLQESLTELIAVAEYCINFRKDKYKWGSEGCYGYPAAILLLSVADSIGSHVLGGSTRNHFNILNHKDYYDLKLKPIEITLIYKNYRCQLTHESTLAVNNILSLGEKLDPIFIGNNENPQLNLAPFLELSKKVVAKFLSNLEK